jgi:hypothetical protein
LVLDLAFDVDFLLRVWLPDDRVFEGAERAVLAFDDAGGEDVRVAMLPNVHKCHTSPRLPTPGRSAGSRAGCHGGCRETRRRSPAVGTFVPF